LLIHSIICAPADDEFVKELDARLKGKDKNKKKNEKRKGKKQRKKNYKNNKNKKRKQEGSNLDDKSDDDSDSDDDNSDSGDDDDDSDSDDGDENDEDELTESEQETSEEERSQGKSNGLVGSLPLKLKLSREALSRLNNRAAGGGDDDAYGDDADDDDDDDGAREEGDAQPKPSIAADKLRQHLEDIENRRLERIRKYAMGVTKRPLKSVISSHQYAPLFPCHRLLLLIAHTPHRTHDDTHDVWYSERLAQRGEGAGAKPRAPRPTTMTPPQVCLSLSLFLSRVVSCACVRVCVCRVRILTNLRGRSIDKMTAIQRLLTAKHSRRRRNKNDPSAVDLESAFHSFACRACAIGNRPVCVCVCGGACVCVHACACVCVHACACGVWCVSSQRPRCG